MRNTPQERNKEPFPNYLSQIYLKSHLSIDRNRISWCLSKDLVEYFQVSGLCEFYLVYEGFTSWMKLTHPLNQLPKQSERLYLIHGFIQSIFECAIGTYFQKDIHLSFFLNPSIIIHKIVIFHLPIPFQNIQFLLTDLPLLNNFNCHHWINEKRIPSEHHSVSTHLKLCLLVDSEFLVDFGPLFGYVWIEHIMQNIAFHLNRFLIII